MTSSSQYAGDPIDCHTTAKSWQGDPEEGKFDTYCWIEGTYTRRGPKNGEDEDEDSDNMSSHLGDAIQFCQEIPFTEPIGYSDKSVTVTVFD